MIVFGQQLDVEGKIKISDDADPASAGMIKYDGGHFQGFNGTEWLVLDALDVLFDADRDTKIEVEQSSDEDQVRITVDGHEALVIKKNAYQTLMLELKNSAGNLFIGQEAGLNNRPDTMTVDGVNNTFLGYQAGVQNTVGDDNTFVGNRAGQNNGTGQDNVFVGKTAGLTNTSGSWNTFLGHNAGMNNIGGFNNVLIGNNAGKDQATGFANIVIGSNAMTSNDSSFNIFIGNEAGRDVESSYGNIGIGTASLLTADGGRNVAVGLSAGQVSLGSRSVLMGEFAGFSNDGDRAVIIGSRAGIDNHEDGIIAIGTDALHFNSGEGNIAIGDSAMIAQYLDKSTVGIGRRVLYSGRSSRSVIVGDEAGKLVNADDNAYIGFRAGYGNETGVHNVFLGANAGSLVDSVEHSVLIGSHAGRSSGDGYSVMIGTEAGRSSFGHNVALGYMAMANGFHDGSVAVGSYALEGGGDSTVAMGYKAGADASVNQGVILGNYAAENASGVFGNQVYIGYKAGQNADGYDVTIIGANAAVNYDGNNAVIIGDEAAVNMSNNCNTVVGSLAGKNYGDSRENTFVGCVSGFGAIDVNVTGDFNTFVGYNSGRNVSSGSSNVVLGRNAGRDIGAGNNNVFLGNSCGYLNRGSGNIFIGHEAGGQYALTNNTLIIDNSNTLDPLIEGNFATDFLSFNASSFNIKTTGLAGSQGARLTLDGDPDENSVLEYKVDNAFKASIGYDDNADQVFIYQGGNGIFVKNGRVGINGLSPVTNALEVNGNASKSSAGDWLANSDSRLKKNIRELDSDEMLSKILTMQGVSYEWNDDKTGVRRPTGEQIGFIAQDIERVWPEKVSADNLGYLQTSYGDYDPVYVEAIKALYERIKQLEERNQKLEETIAKLDLDHLQDVLDKLANSEKGSGISE